MSKIFYLDKRIKTEPQEYAVTFSAQIGELGHAFASLIWGDDVAMATMQKGVGFYPEGNESKIKAAFGGAGMVLDDTWEKAEVILSVLVNQSAFEAAQAVVERWEKPTSYYLGINDCTTFVGELAEAVELETPSRLFSPYPIQFVESLVELNS